MSRRASHDDIERFHAYHLYVPTRTLYLGSEAGDEGEGESGCDAIMARHAVKNLHILDTISDDNITILLNNLGGDKYHCFAIVDAIRACRSRVIIKVLGSAMSAGSLILQAADERVMLPNATQMIHYGTWGCVDHSRTVQKNAKESQRVDLWMEQYYWNRIKEKHPTFTLRKVKDLLDHDTFLTASQSVALGLADRIDGEE